VVLLLVLVLVLLLELAELLDVLLVDDVLDVVGTGATEPTALPISAWSSVALSARL
jgi:hypothetical protein